MLRSVLDFMPLLTPISFGGSIKFRFSIPVCQIKKVRFLDIEKREKTYVTAIDSSGTRSEKVFVPPGGDSRATEVSPNFFDVRALNIQLGNGKATGSGAVAALDLSICFGKSKSTRSYRQIACW